MCSSSRFYISLCAIHAQGPTAHAQSANAAIGVANKTGAVVRRTIPARFNALAKKNAAPAPSAAIAMAVAAKKFCSNNGASAWLSFLFLVIALCFVVTVLAVGLGAI